MLLLCVLQTLRQNIMKLPPRAETQQQLAKLQDDIAKIQQDIASHQQIYQVSC